MTNSVAERVAKGQIRPRKEGRKEGSLAGKKNWTFGQILNVIFIFLQCLLLFRKHLRPDLKWHSEGQRRTYR